MSRSTPSGQSPRSSAFRHRFDLRDEPVLDPDLPILDSLHHLFVRSGERYLLDDYLADAAAGHRIVGSIYVQAGAFLRRSGPPELRGLGEIEFANGVGAMMTSGDMGDIRVCAGIVGYVDLRHGDAAARFLDEAVARAPERFRGIRQGANHSSSPAVTRRLPDQPPAGLLGDERFRRGFAHLEPRGLSFDGAVFHHQLGELAELADAFPNTTIVLNHAGLALGLGRSQHARADVFHEWRAALNSVAARSNVLCKIGGFGLPFWGFGFDERNDAVGFEKLATAWEPYVHAAIEAFGCDRCMMASDYPPDGASAGFVPLWNALKYCVRGVSQPEKQALFHGTAARTYRIDLGRLSDRSMTDEEIS
jgi:predicted TIM-barrel fold metal-dependent hydrolase